ncbi:MAG: hypothetical protein K2X03_15655 [Bryobacteraceae bacterium]|nr:hypothetical protein [Bryobacteraceae bacterium]
MKKPGSDGVPPEQSTKVKSTPAEKLEKLRTKPKLQPSPTPIQNGEPVVKIINGRQVQFQTSSTIVQGPTPNSRTTAEGIKADAAVRRPYHRTGRQAGHRQATALGVAPEDPSNVYPQNSIQNTGTKRWLEDNSAKARRADPSITVQTDSTLINDLGRPGYGAKVPIAERFTQTYRKNGQITEKSDVYLGNFSSSASRYVDEQHSIGKKPDPKILEALEKKDRNNFKAQGHGTVKEALEYATAIRNRSVPNGAANGPDKKAKAKAIAKKIKRSPAPRGPVIKPRIK